MASYETEQISENSQQKMQKEPVVLLRSLRGRKKEKKKRSKKISH